MDFNVFHTFFFMSALYNPYIFKHGSTTTLSLFFCDGACLTLIFSVPMYQEWGYYQHYGQMIVVGSFLIHCRMFSSISAFYPLDASIKTTPPRPQLWQKKVSFQTLPNILLGEGQNCPCLESLLHTDFHICPDAYHFLPFSTFIEQVSHWSHILYT